MVELLEVEADLKVADVEVDMAGDGEMDEDIEVVQVKREAFSPGLGGGDA